jgi:hypothetical protein
MTTNINTVILIILQNAFHNEQKKDLKINKTFSYSKTKASKEKFSNLNKSNSIHKVINSRLKSGNACYHLVQNPLYSNLLSKNKKTKIYRTLIVPVAWLDVRPGLSHLREDHRLRVFEKQGAEEDIQD